MKTYIFISPKTGEIYLKKKPKKIELAGIGFYEINQIGRCVERANSLLIEIN